MVVLKKKLYNRKIKIHFLKNYNDGAANEWYIYVFLQIY